MQKQLENQEYCCTLGCVALKGQLNLSEASIAIYFKVNLLFKKTNIYSPVEAALSECGGRQMASRLGAAWRGASDPVGLRFDPFDGWSHLAGDSERGVRAAAEIGAGHRSSSITARAPNGHAQQLRRSINEGVQRTQCESPPPPLLLLRRVEAPAASASTGTGTFSPGGRRSPVKCMFPLASTTFCHLKSTDGRTALLFFFFF